MLKYVKKKKRRCDCMFNDVESKLRPITVGVQKPAGYCCYETFFFLLKIRVPLRVTRFHLFT